MNKVGWMDGCEMTSLPAIYGLSIWRGKLLNVPANQQTVTLIRVKKITVSDGKLFQTFIMRWLYSGIYVIVLIKQCSTVRALKCIYMNTVYVLIVLMKALAWLWWFSEGSSFYYYLLFYYLITSCVILLSWWRNKDVYNSWTRDNLTGCDRPKGLKGTEKNLT